jgi:hypothetical protein
MSHFKREDGLNYFVLLVFRKVVVKGKPQQAIADSLGDRALALATRQPGHPIAERCNGKIMEDAEDLPLLGQSPR